MPTSGLIIAVFNPVVLVATHFHNLIKIHPKKHTHRQLCLALTIFAFNRSQLLTMAAAG